MTQGLLKKLALAAPLVVCLPFCALAADGPAAHESEDSPKIFEEFSLTSATIEAPAPMGYPPAPAASPAPGAPGPHGRLCGSRSGLLRSRAQLLCPRVRQWLRQ